MNPAEPGPKVLAANPRRQISWRTRPRRPGPLLSALWGGGLGCSGSRKVLPKSRGFFEILPQGERPARPRPGSGGDTPGLGGTPGAAGSAGERPAASFGACPGTAKNPGKARSADPVRFFPDSSKQGSKIDLRLRAAISLLILILGACYELSNELSKSSGRATGPENEVAHRSGTGR